ncbi:serine carboxypeptidase-like 25 isoform X2 [Arachis ipaensis]|nr:serine carboxypeptidase-like 25 isoform X2 [Arachis ipaensis]XP_025650030.1 serine carboxypeptidase-like 25 isoform X2 [Arachis hypogaea]QHO09276.1 Serine carboxypeptidase-like [Arachis hypogaea]
MDEQHHKKIFVVLHQVVVILLVMVVVVGPSSCVKGGEEEDRILELPGQPKVSFQQFSGYVTVNKVAGRALFYWLTESSQNSLRKPLVIWLNGAKDSLEFVVQWLERFPRYKNRELYITGESYAGHYVPQLAREIITYNTNTKYPINLKGIMVGNAVTDNYYDNLGTVTYWWSHAMISDQTYRQLISTCDFHRQKESDECESLYSYAMDQEFGNIDQYNIYAPPCNNSDGSAATSRRAMRLPHRPRHPAVRQLSGYDPCTEKYAEIYYNRPDVQKALHANTTGIPYKWTACSEVLNRNWNDTDVSVLPIYRQLMANRIRVWVFSGDVDSVVPVTATRYALAQLKVATKIPWYPWYVKNQVGGWTEVYEGLTFATVRGAGHEVPLFKPRAALQLFKSFLSGSPLPKS